MSTPPVTCPPAVPPPVGHGLSQRALVSALDSWRVGLTEWTTYWARTVARGATPWDVSADGVRWWRTMTERRRPTWSTPHRVTWTTPIARLRDFSLPMAQEVVPTLILPPQAGHDSCIVDYSDEQSQVKVALAAGLERLWSLDWRGATPQTRDVSIEDYLAVVDRAVQDLGGRVNLVGDCQGGWLGAIYAALRPATVHTLTLAGAPIDFHAGAPLVGEWTRALAPRGDLSFYRTIVGASGGVLKGEHMLAGFVLLKPENEVGKQVQLLAHLDDEVHVARYQAFEDWFKHTQDIAGAFYLWIVEHLFRDNTLIRGELEIGGERVDLGAIACPLNLLAGAEDHITPAPQVFAAAGAVGTPAGDITRMTTSGGHLGLFMGTEALRDYWPHLLAGVAERSRDDLDAASAEAHAANATPIHPPAVPAP